MDILNSTTVTLKLQPWIPSESQEVPPPKPVQPRRTDTDFFGAGSPFLPENLLETVSRLKGPGFAKLRSSLSGQFGIRLQSTGDAASNAQTQIILQTLDASPENPYVVEFDQFILDSFTGPGQFDLVERDSSDIDIFDAEGEFVSGGESEVTIATKSGFTDGVTTGSWSRLAKAITSDKTYSVVFAPGTAGDGIYSMSARALYPLYLS